MYTSYISMTLNIILIMTIIESIIDINKKGDRQKVKLDEKQLAELCDIELPSEAEEKFQVKQSLNNTTVFIYSEEAHNKMQEINVDTSNNADITSEAEDNIDNLNALIDYLKSKVAIAEDESAKAKNQLKAMEKELANAAEEINDLFKKNEEIQELKYKYENSSDLIQSQKENYEKLLAEKENTLNKVEKANETLIAEKDSQISYLLDENDSKKKYSDKLNNNIDALRHIINIQSKLIDVHESRSIWDVIFGNNKKILEIKESIPELPSPVRESEKPYFEVIDTEEKSD